MNPSLKRLDCLDTHFVTNAHCPEAAKITKEDHNERPLSNNLLLAQRVSPIQHASYVNIAGYLVTHVVTSLITAAVVIWP